MFTNKSLTQFSAQREESSAGLRHGIIHTGRTQHATHSQPQRLPTAQRNHAAVPKERQKLQGSYLLLYPTAFMHSSSLSFFYPESHSTLNNKTTVVQIVINNSMEKSHSHILIVARVVKKFSAYYIKNIQWTL